MVIERKTEAPDIFDLGTKVVDNKVLTTYAQDIGPILDEVNEVRKLTNNGWTDDRNMRHVARIPAIEFERNPMLKEAMKHGCLEEAMKVYLQTDEGRQYVIAAIDTGKSGHIKIK